MQQDDIAEKRIYNEKIIVRYFKKIVEENQSYFKATQSSE
jgi:hypothetical protein